MCSVCVCVWDSYFTGLEPSFLCITNPETITQAGLLSVALIIPPWLVVSPFSDASPDVDSSLFLCQRCDVSLVQNRHDRPLKTECSPPPRHHISYCDGKFWWQVWLCAWSPWTWYCASAPLNSLETWSISWIVFRILITKAQGGCDRWNYLHSFQNNILSSCSILNTWLFL